MGKTGSGKSSLINSLCGCSVLHAKQDTKSVTAIPTTVEHHDNDNYELIIKYITLDEFELLLRVKVSKQHVR